MIMEDRDIILMEIPRQLDKLKRPALQQMCKRFGLKANGKALVEEESPPQDTGNEAREVLEPASSKNVDMVRALTRLRQSQASSNISEYFVAVEGAPAPRSPLGSCGTPGESSTVVPPPTSPLQQLQTPVKAANRSSTTRKRSLCSDDVPEHEPPAKRGRRQNKRKGRASKPKRKKTSTDEEELLCMSQNTLQADSSLPSTPQTDEHPLPLLESASEQRRKRKRWSDEATMTPPILLDELPAPKRTRRATYSVSPPSRSAPTIQHVSEVETESEIADVVLPVSPPSHSSESPQVSEVETESEITEVHVVLPVSPPLHSSPQVSEVESEREITEDVPPLSPPDPTSDLESSTRQRHSTYTILEKDSEMMDTSSAKTTSESAVSDVKETSCSEEEDTHTQIMTLLEQRVEERKLDPNYKPVFTASCSKIPVKKSTSAKFDQLHQRRFNRMTSIVEHQRNKEKRAKEYQKRSTFKTPENPRRFEPSVLKPQNASFNFGRKSTLKTPASTASKRPTFPKTAETVRHSKKSFNVKSSLKKTSSFIPRKGKVPDFNFNIY